MTSRRRPGRRQREAFFLLYLRMNFSVRIRASSSVRWTGGDFMKYADGPASGIFIHDLDRALHGRLGPWSTLEWMDQAKRAVQYLRSRSRAAKR